MKKSLIEKEKTGLEMFGAMVNVHSLQGTTTKPKKKSPSPCEAGHLPQGQQSTLGFGNSLVDLTDFPLW